jgi:hypothetical protein
MKFIYLPLLFFLFTGDPGDYTFVHSIPFVQPVQLSTDKLGNAYVVMENQLFQFDEQGKPKANYSESSFGAVTSVDVTNPMKILLFYSSFAKIILLDSKLAFQSDIDLRLIQINQPLAVCTSEENGYWIYDRETDQLKKIDMNLQVIYSSGNLTQVTGYKLQPDMMTENNGYLYMNNPSTGILVFDRYGEYYKTYEYKNLKSFQVIGREILFMRDNKFIRFDTKTREEKEVLLPFKDAVVTARIEQHELYLLTTDSLKFYSF